MRLNELTISSALQGLKKREFTCIDLVMSCFEQITAYDDSIKAFITVIEQEQLRDAAAAVDEKIKSFGDKVFEQYPLLGIPYACKDNFSTKNILTTAASKVLDNYYPPFESTVTQRLKDAGAILIGKTNMDAFAHGSSTEQSDFFTTSNPWDVTKLPGGSSGGSGAAVAANMCIFAIGTETGGSIRCPASWCGITGLKPTYGRVSRYGAVAMASSTDCPGPMTKNVADSAYVLAVIAGKDANDATSSEEEVINYVETINKITLKNLKLGIAESFFDGTEDGIQDIVRGAIKVLSSECKATQPIELLHPKYTLAVYTILQRSEVSSNLARLSGVRYGNDRSTFGDEAKKRMMLGAYALSSGYYDEYYAKAQKVRTLIINDFERAFDKVDLILTPTVPTVALDKGASATSPIFGELTDRLNEPASIAGLASITVPCGTFKNLPVGLQIMGPQFSEDKIFALAAKLQEKTKYHLEKPSLKKSQEQI